MTLPDIAAIVGVLGGLGGVAAVIVALSQALKWKAEASRLQAELNQNAKLTDIKALRDVIDELQERNATLYSRVLGLETALETERCKRRDLEAVVMAKDKRISDLEAEVAELQRQVKEMGGTPRRRKPTGPLG